MNKKIIRYIISSILGIIMIIAFIYLGTKDYTKNTVLEDQKSMSSWFNKLPKENRFKILKNSEASRFIRNDTGIILFCIKSSEWCNYYVNIVNDVAIELDIEEIYYFDILADRNSKSYFYHKILTVVSPFLTKNDLGEYMFFTPDLYIVNNGIILGHNNETALNVGNSTPKEYWTNTKINGLKITLRELFKKLEVEE